jgi:hypothetical protein
MSNNELAAPPRQRSKTLIAGTALICGAAVLGLVGLGLTTTALIAAARERMARMEVPPRELARRTWIQTRAATTAGRSAWRDMAVVPPVRAGDDSPVTAPSSSRPLRERAGM